jgi:hypothetical protein
MRRTLRIGISVSPGSFKSREILEFAPRKRRRADKTGNN